MQVTYEKLLSGDAGTDQTIQRMEGLVAAGARNLTIRERAVSLIGGAASTDEKAEVSALFKYVRDKIRFVKDPVGVEMIAAPEYTMRVGTGDCDDKSVLLASLLQSVGYKTRFHVVGTRVGAFHHVFIDVWFRGGWLPLDATYPGTEPGQTAGGIVREKTYTPQAVALGEYDAALVDRLSQVVHPGQIEASAWEAIQHEANAGNLTLADVQYSRQLIRGPIGGTMPVWQRSMIDRLAIRASALPQVRNLRVPVGMSGQEVGLGGFFSSIWDGIKKIVGPVLRTTALIVAPIATLATRAVKGLIDNGIKGVTQQFGALVNDYGKTLVVEGAIASVVVPGIGKVVSAVTGKAGEIIAGVGADIAGRATVHIKVNGQDFTQYQNLTPAITQAATPIAADTTAVSQAGILSGIPSWVLLTGAAAGMLLLLRRR